MKKTTETLRGNYFFKRDELVHVNRNDENFAGPFHDHDFLEIAYIVEGEGFHHIGESVQKVRKGELFYLPIGISHVFRPTSTSGQKLVVINCLFSPSLLPKLIAFASEQTTMDFLWRMKEGNVSNYSVRDRNDRFDRLFHSLFEQFAARKPGYEDMLHALLFQLIVELHRSMGSSGTTEQSLPKEAAFQDLLHALHNNCEQELTLSHLARISGFSERHLQRLFRQHTGQSWFKYWQSVRIRRSSELLLRTSDKIQYIAEAVGYKDIHSFNTVFKRLTGMTPSQYRKQELR